MSEVLSQTVSSYNILFSFLREVIEYRLKKEFIDPKVQFPPYDNIILETSPLSNFILKNELTINEVLTLLLAVVPHILPNYLNTIISDFFPNGGDLPEFGGVKGKNHRGIIPTGETVQFILAGNDIEKRIHTKSLFEENHLFAKEGVLHLEQLPGTEPKMSGRLIIDEEYLELFTTGNILKPKLSNEFPSQKIQTTLEWNDLVLNQKTLGQIKELEDWLKYNHIVMDQWNMKDKIKPGYRIMFYGPPGTGKTLTATLLGKYTNKDVYRVDLSMIMSKYIGETEKNLSKLFDKSENKDWILFFDEADAIYSKRTNVRDAHDVNANQQVAYLLQRIESHPGLVILASNFKNNIDSAFTRRFQSIIEFETPSPKERLVLWENNLPKNILLAKDVELESIAKKYEITGSNIVNIIQYVCLKSISEGFDKKEYNIKLEHIIEGIKKEYIKEEKMM